MTITELGAIGELVGGVAVIGTLAYLAAQVRHSTKTARSASYQAAVASVSEWTRCVGSDLALSLLFHQGSLDPSPQTREQRIQYSYLFASLVRNFENIHYQYKNGALDDSTWEPWAARIHGTFVTPGAREFWALQRNAYSAAFREFVESTPPTTATPLPLPSSPDEA